MNPSVGAALEELAKLPRNEALTKIAALEKKRFETQFIKYWRPYAKQAEALRGFTAEKKIFGILGGNRAGKSITGAALVTAWALGRKYFEGEPAWEWVQTLPIPDPPNNIWVVGLDFPTVRDVIWREKLRFGKKHPAFLPKDSSIRDIKDGDYQVFFDNGSIITCKSADSGREKFQGAGVDLIWIDEEPESDIYDECYQRTIDTGGKIFITLTPLTDSRSGARLPWVFDLYEEFKRGRSDVSFAQLSLFDNPFVPEEEKVKATAKWAGHVEEKARLYGEFVQRSGLVYAMWEPAKHIVRPFTLSDTWPRIVSIDPAATGYTAAVWAAINSHHDVYLYREYYERDLTVSEHAKNIKIRCGGDNIDYWLIDPKWGTQRNAESHKTGAQLYRDNGIPVRLPEVGEDYGLNKSREYLLSTVTPSSRHPSLYVFEGLPSFRWEIEHYTWDFYQKGEQKGLSKERPRKYKDHLMNAMQYLLATGPRGAMRGEELSDEDKRAASKLNSYT